MRIPKFEAQTEWNIPTEFPDLRQVDEIAIDLETKDPDLKEKGSGSVNIFLIVILIVYYNYDLSGSAEIKISFLNFFKFV